MIFLKNMLKLYNLYYLCLTNFISFMYSEFTLEYKLYVENHQTV